MKRPVSTTSRSETSMSKRRNPSRRNIPTRHMIVLRYISAIAGLLMAVAALLHAVLPW